MDRELIQRYLLLGLRLGRHIDGLVDAYYGPPGLAEQVAAEPRVAAGELARESVSLGREIRVENGTPRAKWLEAQLDGMATVAARLDGAAVPYGEEILRCYGFTPVLANEEELEEAHRLAAVVLPGQGSLRERLAAWRHAHEVPADQILPALKAVAGELRARTVLLYGLPRGESADLEIVSHEPWAGFNYYLGRRRSRVVVNTDIPVGSSNLVVLAAHECYPGHHTEHALKETLLVEENGFLEESLFLIGTPQSLVSEGIATNALAAAGDEAEGACEARLREMGHGYDVGEVRALREILFTIDRAWTNVAFMIHDKGRDVEDARAFAARWIFESDEAIAKRLEFIVHPVWRGYIALYDNGERIVASWTGGSPEKFKRLLTEQLTTADLLAAPIS